MLKKFRLLLASIIIGLLISSGVTYAATRSLEALYNNIKLVVDGVEITPRDATCSARLAINYCGCHQNNLNSL